MSWAVILMFIIFMLIAVVIIFQLIEQNEKLNKTISSLTDENTTMRTQNDVLINRIESIDKMADNALTDKGATFVDVLHALREIKKVSSKKLIKLTNQKN